MERGEGYKFWILILYGAKYCKNLISIWQSSSHRGLKYWLINSGNIKQQAEQYNNKVAKGTAIRLARKPLMLTVWK